MWLVAEPLPWRAVFLDYNPFEFALGSWYHLVVPGFLIPFAFRSFELTWYPLERMFLWTIFGLIWKLLALLSNPTFDISSYPLIFGLAGFYAYFRKKSQMDRPESEAIVFHDAAK